MSRSLPIGEGEAVATSLDLADAVRATGASRTLVDELLDAALGLVPRGELRSPLEVVIALRDAAAILTLAAEVYPALCERLREQLAAEDAAEVAAWVARCGCPE